jgi:hypothetical protein
MSRFATSGGSIMGKGAAVRGRADASLGLRSKDFVLLELAVKGGLADTEDLRSGDFIAVGFAQGADDGAAFEFLERNDFILLGKLLNGWIVQVGGQLGDVD